MIVSRLDSQRRLKIAAGITAVFMLGEFLGGVFANSLALIADSGHMLTDLGALALSLYAARVAERPATERKTYGFGRAEILAALANGAILAALALIISWQAILRLRTPAPINGRLMLLVAVVGLGANLAAAWVLFPARGSGLNLKAAFLHVFGDAAGSLGVIIAAGLIIRYGISAADPFISLGISLLILSASWRVVRGAVDVLLEGVPAGVDPDQVRTELSCVDGVRAVHDLHIWSLNSGEHALSCHAVVNGEAQARDVLAALGRAARRYGISHTTIQVEEEDLRPQEAHHP